MAQSVLDMAKELVAAQIKAGSISPDTMSEVLTKTHRQLLSLKLREESGPQSGVDQPGSRLSNWKKSIGKHAVICLECGASSKQLDIRHLRQHNLDKRSYQQKYGIPRTQSLASKDTMARRKAAVQQSRPWEKSPRYLKTQEKTVKSKGKLTTPTKAPAKRKTRAKRAKAT